MVDGHDTLLPSIHINNTGAQELFIFFKRERIFTINKLWWNSGQVVIAAAALFQSPHYHHHHHDIWMNGKKIIAWVRHPRKKGKNSLKIIKWHPKRGTQTTTTTKNTFFDRMWESILLLLLLLFGRPANLLLNH